MTDTEQSEMYMLQRENKILKANLAHINNFCRHRFDDAIDKATTELFKALAYHRMTNEQYLPQSDSL